MAPHSNILQKTSSNIPNVVWADESKNGLRFETEPSYDSAPTLSQYATAWQSSNGATFVDLAAKIRQQSLIYYY